MMAMVKKLSSSTCMLPAVAVYLFVLLLLSSRIVLSESAAVCDDSKCLSDACLVPVVRNDDHKVASSALPTLPCADELEGRRIDGQIDLEQVGHENNVTTGISTADLYTCCDPGYGGLSLQVLEECSTEACASPDGKGGSDCSADGFIHPMVCSTDTMYKYPRKEPDATIYSPYVCCTTPGDDADTKLLVAASIWTVLSGITFLACSILILAILRSKKARAQGYNLYLVFLAIPDAFFNLFSLARNIINISGNHLSSEMGGTVHALEWFHTAANMWLTALIVFQVHTMLTKSQHFERTPPPTVKQVCAQSAGVYAFSALWAAWSLALLLQGQNMFSNTNAAWLTSKALMVGPPFVYVIASCTHVWWKQLLPRQGRTRVLSLYFLRVVIVFFLTWVPFLILVDVTYYKTQSLWMLGLAYYFSSLQGLLSVLVALGKPDVKRAVTKFLCCRGDEFNETEGRFLGSNASSLGKSMFGSVTRQFSSSLRLNLSRTSESGTSQRFGPGKSSYRNEENAPTGHSTIPSTGRITFHNNDASQIMSIIESERAECDDCCDQHKETANIEDTASVNVPFEEDLEDGATKMESSENAME